MRLTDREFWLNYWENKGDLTKEIGKTYILSKILSKAKEDHNIKSGIELGGFPGYYAVYFKKWLKIESALFDYVIHKEISKSLIEANSLSEGDIELIEGDLFSHEPQKEYDLVLSVGLIEHFEDIQNVIKQHLKFLKPKGFLFINIPNFTGFNGMLQQKFDLELYKKHNISSMDINFLKDCCENLGLKNIQVNYYGGFMMWLENIKTKSLLFRITFKAVWFILKVFSKLHGQETKYFSPYINITATK